VNRGFLEWKENVLSDPPSPQRFPLMSVLSEAVDEETLTSSVGLLSAEEQAYISEKILLVFFFGVGRL